MFQGVKVFSATLADKRERLGEDVTRWLKDNQDKEIVDKVIRQSSDAAFHCLTIILFYNVKSRRGGKK
jgi:hypothetical protein